MLYCNIKNSKTLYKKIIYTGLLNIGINNYIYCKCSCKNEKNKENNINNNNDNTDENVKDNEDDKKPPKDEHKDDPLKNEKDKLKNLLNTVNQNNNNLGEDKIICNITAEIIDSKTEINDLQNIEEELNNINNQIIEKISKTNEEKAKEILKNDCITLFDNCEKLNNVIEKQIILRVTKKEIGDEKDIDQLNKYKTILNNKKKEIENERNKEIEDKRKIITELIEKNDKLKEEVIEKFYENKVIKSKYDDEITEEKTFAELGKIKEELDYISKDVFYSETIDEKDYLLLYYDEISEDLKSDNIYRIMYIFNEFIIFNTENTFVLAKNEGEYENPFKRKITIYKYSFDILNTLLENDEIFYCVLSFIIKATDSNSYFSNFFKSKFYHDDKKTDYFVLERVCINFLNIVLDFKDFDEKKNEKKKFLEENKIELGDKIDDEKLILYKHLKIKDLNDQVIGEAEKVLKNRREV